MFLSVLKRCRLSMTLALCAFLISTGAWATGDPPPDPSGCIELSMECVDAPAYGAPIQLYGVVTNCGDQAFQVVNVRNLDPKVIFLDQGPLGPGESFSWSGEIVPDPYECPFKAVVRARGLLADGTVVDDRTGDGDGTVVDAYANATCDCPEFVEVCRTPGFWGLHAGTEKSGSYNITQAVIDAAPAGLMVCGETVDNTALDSFGSALEAMCVSVRSEQVLQLARQLTAAALNCVVSGSPMDCDGASIATRFADCNAACATGTDPDEIGYCERAIDCWNNGGTLLESGICQLGVCAHDGAPCEESEDCGYDLEGTEIECIPFTDTCHYELLVNEDLGLFFEPPGSAGSPKACNSAIKNDCGFFEGCDD